MERKKSNSNHFISLLEIPDFDLLVIVAIGSRDFIQQDIKYLYNQNKEYYYGLFRSSPYYQDDRIKSLSALNYQTIQQFIGLYLHEKNVAKNELTMKFIKKGYKFIFNFVKNNNQIDLYKLRDAHLAYVKKNNFLKTVHSAHIFGIALFLCKEFNKEILYDDFDIKLINSSLSQIFSELRFELSINEETVRFLKQYQSIGIQKKDFTLPLNELITFMNQIHKEQYAAEHHMDFTDPDAERKFNDSINDHPFYKGIEKTAILLQYFNIHPIDLQNITEITHCALNELVEIARLTLDDFSNEEEWYSLIGSYLLVYSLIKDYNATKHNYLITSAEEVYHELQQLKKDYENKITSLHQQEELKNKEINYLSESNVKLHSTTLELEKQILKKDKMIQNLQDQLSKLEAKQKDRDQKEEKVESHSEVDIEEIINYINRKRCVIVGGNKSWQEKLRNLLSNCRFIEPDELNIDFDFLSTQDFIVFNEAYNNHAMFYKIKDRANDCNIPIFFMGTTTNIKLSLGKIYEQAKQMLGITE